MVDTSLVSSVSDPVCLSLTIYNKSPKYQARSCDDHISFICEFGKQKQTTTTISPPRNFSQHLTNRGPLPAHVSAPASEEPQPNNNTSLAKEEEAENKISANQYLTSPVGEYLFSFH